MDDPAAALVDDDEVAAFLADALETGDVAFIAKSLGVVARAKGMAEIARQTGLKTTLAVMKALGVDLTAKTHSAA